MKFDLSPECAIQLDEKDPLADYRQQFSIPHTRGGQPVIYFCGNSLGLMPHSARAAMNREMDRWEQLVIEGYFGENGWLHYQERLAGPMAGIVGALPQEVVVMNGLTVNLHLLMLSFFRPQGKRRKILIEKNAFPSDQYAAASQLKLHGLDPSQDLMVLPVEADAATHQHLQILEMIEQHGDEIAMVLLSGINYYSGQAFDIGEITAAARQKGCIVGWDLAHVAGNLPLQLHDWQVDFAVWCTYKYLNSGPGSPAAAFVHQKHHGRDDLLRLNGWWGNDLASRFDMRPEFDADRGARAWQISCPPVLAFPPLEASLNVFAATDMLSLRQKSIQLTGYLAFLLRKKCDRNLQIITPENPPERGCQLSLVITEHGRAIFERLTAAGIVCDWREPDVIRVAPVPLYNTFREVWQFSEIISRILYPPVDKFDSI